MIEIPLTQGKVALIDEEDFELVNNYKWHYNRKSHKYGFAVASGGRRGLRIIMHRLITNAPPGFEVDHINGNPLDNRRNNLRIVTHSQNQKNMRTSPKSGYKGVSWQKKAKKWQVHLMNNGKKYYLGLFCDIKEAAKAYNIAALEHFGEFAKLNDIKP